MTKSQPRLPAYLPPDFRKYAEQLSKTLSTRMETLAGEAAELNLAIERWPVDDTKVSNDEAIAGTAVLEHMRRRRKSVSDRLADANRAFDCAIRLLTDRRMKDVFSGTKYGLSAAVLIALIDSACAAAVLNYGAYRDGLNRSRDAAREIARLSAELSELVESFATQRLGGQESGVNSVQTLMRLAQRGGLFGSYTWDTIQRPTLLGDTPDFWPLDDAASRTAAQEMVGAAWSSAPTMAALLASLSDVAKVFNPQTHLDAPLSVAVTKRQAARRPEYVRAFAGLLISRGVAPTSTLQSVIALTATVVFDDPNVDITQHEVRKILQRANLLSGAKR